MSDKTSDIGAVRLGALAVGVVVVGLGLGAFVSYLDAENSQPDSAGTSDSNRNGQQKAPAEPGDDEQTSSAMRDQTTGGILSGQENVDEWSAAMNAAAHAADLGQSVGSTAHQRASADSRQPSDVQAESGATSDEPARLKDNGLDDSTGELEAQRAVDDGRGASVQSTASGQPEADDKNDRRSRVAPTSAGFDENLSVISTEEVSAEHGTQTAGGDAAETVDRGGRAAGAVVIAARGGEQEAASGGRSGDEASSDSSSEAEDSPDDGEFSAENVARRIQKFYRNTEDFKSNFKQVYRDIAAGDKKVRWGKVYFKTPGKMRWDYYDKEGLEDRTKTLVSDGDYLWIYELEFQQVFKECLSEKQLPTSLKFLMGKGQLLDDFDVSFTEESTREAPELELVPKEPTPKYKKLHFKVDADAEQVTETTVFDPYGNTNTIHFNEVTLNSNLPDSGFAFEPPEDARLLNKNVSCD
jgi:outer membrane lipoprotein carrier protein